MGSVQIILVILHCAVVLVFLKVSAKLFHMQICLWWKCSGNYLVSCVFGKAWVILESRKYKLH